MTDFPDNWFDRLVRLSQRPDILSGVEMHMIGNLLHTRGAPSPVETATVERAWQRMLDDGLSDAGCDC